MSDNNKKNIDMKSNDLEKSFQDLNISTSSDSSFEIILEKETEVETDEIEKYLKDLKLDKIPDYAPKSPVNDLAFTYGTKPCNKVMFKDEKWTVCSNDRCTYAHTMQQLKPIVCDYDVRCKNKKCVRKHSNESFFSYCKKNKFMLPSEISKKPVYLKLELPSSLSDSDLHSFILQLVTSKHYSIL